LNTYYTTQKWPEANVIQTPVLGHDDPDNIRFSQSENSKPVYFLQPDTDPVTTDFSALNGMSVLLIAPSSLTDATADALARSMLKAGATIVYCQYYAEGPFADEWEPAGSMLYREKAEAA